jgi:uncharacterized protein (TIGR04168 family)
MTSPRSGATLYIVGDVHNHWREADRAFLESVPCDLAAFVGDLGDEDAEIAEAIARVDVPKAVLLGNHDAWQSFSHRRTTPKLRAVLDVIGDDHLGYGLRECYEGGFSMIGARPFSWGGPSLRSSELYRELYGVASIQESASLIVDLARRAEHRDLVILAHNGPKGLSEEPGDIWGKDFGTPGGDWGDEDLQLALDRIREIGLRIRLVIAGHMHERLAYPRGAVRTRFVTRDGTLYLNAAVVPRLRPGEGTNVVGHFVRVQMSGGEVGEIAEVFVDPYCRVQKTTYPEVLALPSAWP